MNDTESEAGCARDALALIGASWLSVRGGDIHAAMLARQLTAELAEAGEQGVTALAAAAVAVLDAVDSLAGPDVVATALEQAGAPGTELRHRRPE